MLVVLMLAGMRLWAERTKLMKALALGIAVIALGAIGATYSRSTAVTLVIILFLLRFLRFLTTRQMVAATVAGVLLVAVASPGFVTRVMTLSSAAGGMRAADPAVQGRATENLAVA